MELPPDDLAGLDQLCRHQRISRLDAVQAAVRWYLRWGELLPIEDPTEDEIDR